MPFETPKHCAAEDPSLVAISAETLRSLLNERSKLRALVAQNTAAQEARLSRCVRAFMFAIGQEVKSTPEVPDLMVVKLRLRLITEEFVELLKAAGVRGLGHVDERLSVQDNIMALIDDLRDTQSEPLRVNMPELADALSDLRVVIVGTDAAFGINGDAVDRLVMDANMKKLEGEDDEHGKRQKPPGWMPPDIAGELRRQGWAG